MTKSNDRDNSIKRVDEDWKQQIAQEKAAAGAKDEAQPRQQAEESRPEPVTSELFLRFLSSLAAQAVSALGEMPNPMTGAVEENLDNAKYLIDTIGAIEEKTRGNLSQEESRMLKEMLYTLRMKFVAKTSPGGTAPAPEKDG